jgi:predicted kinase
MLWRAMLPRPKAFLLHGFIGVGKTTFARRLEREQGAVRFTHDEWMSRLHGSDPPAADFQDHAGRIFAVMESVWTRCLELGTNVVLDYGFWTRAERAHVGALVAKHGGEPVLYRLTCSGDVAMRRIAERNGQSGTLYIAPETYRTLQARFEPLGSDEACIDHPPDIAVPQNVAVEDGGRDMA